ncbi:hypothetical protein N9E48_10940 [Paracoccaceae bacterium]|nr:hypothetical protein [Paracoccaceae bacterium]
MEQWYFGSIDAYDGTSWPVMRGPGLLRLIAMVEAQTLGQVDLLLRPQFQWILRINQQTYGWPFKISLEGM